MSKPKTTRKRKPSRGGARPGAGRPPTGINDPAGRVVFKLHPDDRAAAQELATRLMYPSVPALAKALLLLRLRPGQVPEKH